MYARSPIEPLSSAWQPKAAGRVDPMRHQAGNCTRLALLCLAVVLAACSTLPAVRTEYDPQIDFAQYRTFGFIKPLGTDRSGYETLVSQNLKSAARRQMELRGYRYTDTNPDLLINFNAHLTDRVEIARVPISPAEYYGYRSYATWRDYDIELAQYKEGTLNIDVVDAARGQLVWEGIATGPVTAKVYKNRQLAIEQAVEQVFGKYPVPATRGSP